MVKVGCLYAQGLSFCPWRAQTLSKQIGLSRSVKLWCAIGASATFVTFGHTEGKNSSQMDNWHSETYMLLTVGLLRDQEANYKCTPCLCLQDAYFFLL